MNDSSGEKILAIDIGGSHIKATMLNEHGELLTDYEKMITPRPATPESVVNTIKQLARNLPGYDKVSAGFPGYIKNGVVYTAPNLDNEHWKSIDLATQLGNALGKPVKVVNDADLQGIGVVDGKGFELVITLGTGFGTALLLDGKLLPHLELAHHPLTKKYTYDDYIGEKALEKIGVDKWNKRIKKVFAIIKTVFNYDHLYISGGNSAKLKQPLDDNMTIVTNKDGIRGGAKLWFQ